METNIVDNTVAIPNSSVPSEPRAATPIIENAPFVSEQKEQPFTLFARENQMPYTAKYFGIDKQSFDELAQADITDLVPKMEAIENYVLEKIIYEEYFDSTQTFKDIISNLKDMLGIKEVEPFSQQINRIFTYINEGKPIQQEFMVKRNSKADELEHSRYKMMSEKKQAPSFRKVDNLFNKFFNK